LERDCASPNRTGRHDVSYPKRYHVAASKFAVDRQVKQGKVTNAPFNLEPDSDASHMHRPEWQLGA